MFTHNGDANLTIDRTEIRNNSAATHGGGISNGRFDATGTSFIAGGTLSITNSTIASNSATGFGGGIASAGPLTVTTSAIDNNAISGPAAGCGGGIYSTQLTDHDRAGCRRQSSLARRWHLRHWTARARRRRPHQR